MTKIIHFASTYEECGGFDYPAMEARAAEKFDKWRAENPQAVVLSIALAYDRGIDQVGAWVELRCVVDIPGGTS